MMLTYQPLVRRLSGDTRASGPMAVPRKESRVPGLLLILAAVAWSAHCFATVPGQHVVQTTPVPMGYPGSTTTDWAEGTYSDKLPELRIGFRNYKRYMR